MGKRATGDEDGAAAFRKRQKITHDVPTGEEVTSSEQLRSLLAFDQDLRRARHGLQSLKLLLDDAITADDTDRKKEKLAIVTQYLEAVKPRDRGEDTVYLPDIMEMWSFAAQVNDDGVLSAVAVVLALILQIISGSLELVPQGVGICQTLLQESQLKSLSKNLSSEKGKGFVISPTLRLLREAVCLDGGAFARRIVRARNFTFTSLGRNLELGFSGDGQEDVRKASVRTNAVRFLLSCLKYLHSDGKRDILSQRDLFSHLTYMIKIDPPQLIIEILDTLKSHVLMDHKIPRDAKFKCFNIKTLVRILSLYSYVNAAGDEEDKEAVAEKAHQFLLYICTTPGAGILYPSKGLYPKESDEEISRRPVKGQQINDDGSVWKDTFHDGIPVYNFVLSEFARKLRPWSTLRHNELLVATFTAAPELIADYFFNNRAFTFEPKVSTTWLGYAAFLFSTMSIPLPPAFGDTTRYATTPPPTSIVLDNILLLPINQKVLIRCLSPDSDLTSFFATRILVLALEKLNTAIKMHEEGSRLKNSVWIEATRRLLDAFCQRIPDMKEVVRCYKGVSADNMLHKALTSRLLRLYYEIIPRVALSANFDVSPFFVDVLKNVYDDDAEPEAQEYSFMELENLVAIASYSPGMRWFSKIENVKSGEALSPFTSLLQLLCDSKRRVHFVELRTVLAQVAIENQLVLQSTGLTPILRALRCTLDERDGVDPLATWSFLDNCINRCATAPIKYLDLLNSHLADLESAPKDDNVSLLTNAIVEQLPFATKSATPDTGKGLARFLSFYFNAAYKLDESKALLKLLHQKVHELLSSNSVDLKAFGDLDEVKVLSKSKVNSDRAKSPEENVVQERTTLSSAALEALLQIPFSGNEDTSVLTKWSSKSVEDLIEDGWVERLVRLLLSEHTNIRKEALMNLLKMAAQFDQSSYEEKMQVWLLLSELAESSKTLVDNGPVPSVFTAFTIHSMEILKSPLHPLYPKINAYLARSPIWSPEKLPLAHDILHGEPSEDDKYYTEISWLLSYLVDGLRTSSDLGVFHKHRWFEKILALGSNPYVRPNIRNKILKIVYRATCIDGGSSTIVTRFGALSWLDAQRAACGEVKEDAAVYEALIRRVWETCDQKRVTAWSKGGIEKLVGRFNLA